MHSWKQSVPGPSESVVGHRREYASSGIDAPLDHHPPLAGGEGAFCQHCRVAGMTESNKRPPRDAVYWAKKRGISDLLGKTVRGIAAEIGKTGTYRDPAHAKLVESRKAVVAGWQGIARSLDEQGEIELAGDVHYFVSTMPKALTDGEKLAIDFIAYVNRDRAKRPMDDRVRHRRIEITR